MLSKIIKERIEQRFGQPIRYSKDCEALAASISKHCKANISPSTLKRLFGFNQSTQLTRPRLYTLDVLSTYLGFPTWNDLMNSLNKSTEPAIKIIDHITPAELRVGEEIVIGFNAGNELNLSYKGNALFEVIRSTVKEVLHGDQLKIGDINLHYPLFITQLIREDRNIGKLTIGDIGGITLLKRSSKGKAKK